MASGEAQMLQLRGSNRVVLQDLLHRKSVWYVFIYIVPKAKKGGHFFEMLLLPLIFFVHSRTQISDFWKEACTLGQLHHPNVVAFYGIVPDGPDGTLATVTEYMVNGSLKQVLQKKDRFFARHVISKCIFSCLLGSFSFGTS